MRCPKRPKSFKNESFNPHREPKVAVLSFITTIISADSDKRDSSQEIREEIPSKKEDAAPADNRNIFYSSVSFLQFEGDTELFDLLQESGDYERILQEATEYDSGDAPNLAHTYKSPVQYRGDDLLIENDRYVVVYNNSVGGTYDILRKVTEEDVRDNIIRYGLPREAPEDVKSVATRIELSLREQKHEGRFFETLDLSPEPPP